jgi:mevalonate kinase
VVSIPGKTFLVGEYSVLVGGEALGLATAPCFKLSEKKLNIIQ